MKTSVFLLLGVLLVGAMAWEEQANGMISFIGPLVHNSLEGGFFAIDAVDGRKLMPITLPKEFAVDGLRVQVSARPKADLADILMCGMLIEIVEISTL